MSAVLVPFLPAEETPPVTQAQEDTLLARITVNPEVFAGKLIIRGRRLAVEHVLGMLVTGDSFDDLLREYRWLERDDVHTCLGNVNRLVGHDRVEPAVQKSGRVKVLIDSCVAGSVAAPLAAAGHGSGASLTGPPSLDVHE